MLGAGRPNKNSIFMEQLSSMVMTCFSQGITSLMHTLPSSSQFLFTTMKMIGLVIDCLFVIRKLRDVILFMIRNLEKEICLND